jgi:hypothetical protein
MVPFNSYHVNAQSINKHNYKVKICKTWIKMHQGLSCSKGMLAFLETSHLWTTKTPPGLAPTVGSFR